MQNNNFFNKPALVLAKKLLGCKLVSSKNNLVTSGIIVETEAYSQDDAASHSYKGETLRNSVMFGPAGHAYVYFTYGMHYCLNVVAGENGKGEAVLIRALHPIEGIETMKQRRQVDKTQNLCNGPAKLVQSLGLGKLDNGLSLFGPELKILPAEQSSKIEVDCGARIGISRAKDKPWRFWVKGNMYVSGSRKSYKLT